jgi:C_GCAxxG_C_C family probable redox protein
MNERDLLIKKVQERAQFNYTRGLNSAESVLDAVLSGFEVEYPPEVLSMATGLGEGVGAFGGTCGALTGAVLAVGFFHGRKEIAGGRDPSQYEVWNNVDFLRGRPGRYRLFNQLPNAFKLRFGNTLCHDLTVMYQEDWELPERKRFCSNLVVEAAGLASEMIFEGREQGFHQPFGLNVGRYERMDERGT